MTSEDASENESIKFMFVGTIIRGRPYERWTLDHSSKTIPKESNEWDGENEKRFGPQNSIGCNDNKREAST